MARYHSTRKQATTKGATIKFLDFFVKKEFLQNEIYPHNLVYSHCMDVYRIGQSDTIMGFVRIAGLQDES
jgi:hypothetical protein